MGDSIDFDLVPWSICVHHLPRKRHGRAKRAKEAHDDLRRIAGFSVADEIDKLDKLRKSGSITGEEFTRLPAKLVQ